jgi:hypothetical protein
MLADQRNQLKLEPPSYSLDEIVEKWCSATKGSVTKESAPYLMKRNISTSANCKASWKVLFQSCLVMLSEKPEYNEKIKLFIALAPVAFMTQ